MTAIIAMMHLPHTAVDMHGDWRIMQRAMAIGDVMSFYALGGTEDLMVNNGGNHSTVQLFLPTPNLRPANYATHYSKRVLKLNLTHL